MTLTHTENGEGFLLFVVWILALLLLKAIEDIQYRNIVIARLEADLSTSRYVEAAHVAKVGLEGGLPVIYGIITADTLEQAIERAGTKMGNRGFDAAVEAIEMANLVKSIA